MMVTEDRARLMWCPDSRIARYSSTDTTTINRPDKDQPNGTQCLASGCMAWVWDTVSVGHCGRVRHLRLASRDEFAEEMRSDG